LSIFSLPIETLTAFLTETWTPVETVV